VKRDPGIGPSWISRPIDAPLQQVAVTVDEEEGVQSPIEEAVKQDGQRPAVGEHRERMLEIHHQLRSHQRIFKPAPHQRRAVQQIFLSDAPTEHTAPVMIDDPEAQPRQVDVHVGRTEVSMNDPVRMQDGHDFRQLAGDVDAAS
jgi:hypothetical protein